METSMRTAGSPSSGREREAGAFYEKNARQPLLVSSSFANHPIPYPPERRNRRQQPVHRAAASSMHPHSFIVPRRRSG
jgi:hypothetical protein